MNNRLIKRNRGSGFTIIELIVVIVVLSTLATLSFLGISQYQKSARDSQRAASATVITEALESYYDDNGVYPSCSTMTAPSSQLTETGGVLESLNASVLVAPLAETGITNSVQCADLEPSSEVDFFSYLGDGTETCNSGDYCHSYTFKYKNESDGQIVSIVSRHDTRPVDAPTGLTLTVSGTSITATWNSVAGAVGYNLDISTSNTFASGVSSYNNLTTTSRTITGLTAGSTYYVRVSAKSSKGAISGYITANATIIGQTTGVAINTDTCGQAVVTWNATAGAATYKLAYAKSGGSATTIDGITGTSRTITGLDQNASYSFTVTPVTSSGANGQQSSTVPATITVCPPAAYSMSCSWNGTTMTCTSQATCGAGTTANYYWYNNGSAWVTGTQHKTVSYTPGYDSNNKLTVNTQCSGSAWVGASNNSGNFNRGVPAPGAPWWGTHVVSNNLNMSWGVSWCTVGTTYTRVLIYRRSNGVLTQDSGWLNSATSWRRASLPVASWDSYVLAFCQGSTGSSGEVWSAVGRAG